MKPMDNKVVDNLNRFVTSQSTKVRYFEDMRPMSLIPSRSNSLKSHHGLNWSCASMLADETGQASHHRHGW